MAAGHGCAGGKRKRADGPGSARAVDLLLRAVIGPADQNSATVKVEPLEGTVRNVGVTTEPSFTTYIV